MLALANIYFLDLFSAIFEMIKGKIIKAITIIINNAISIFISCFKIYKLLDMI